MLAVALLLQVTPPPGINIARDEVTIDKVVWYDANGKKQVTDKLYLQIRLKLTNKADHAIAWPGFRKARLQYGKRYGSAMFPVNFGPNSRIGRSVLKDELVEAGKEYEILLVFEVPRVRGSAALELQWNGEKQGWVSTVKSGFRLPEDN
jgi:hypothetical protein